jgi:hypothetical protein
LKIIGLEAFFHKRSTFNYTAAAIQRLSFKKQKDICEALKTQSKRGKLGVGRWGCAFQIRANAITLHQGDHYKTQQTKWYT